MEREDIPCPYPPLGVLGASGEEVDRLTIGIYTIVVYKTPDGFLCCDAWTGDGPASWVREPQSLPAKVADAGNALSLACMKRLWAEGWREPRFVEQHKWRMWREGLKVETE